MKRLIAVRLTAALAMLLGGVLPASAQSSSRFEGFYCQLDLKSADITRPPRVAALHTTTNSTKVCSGGPEPQDIVLECVARIANWPSRNVKKNNVPCMVNAAPCGLEGFLDDPFTSSLQINSTGRAFLRCQFKPS